MQLAVHQGRSAKMAESIDKIFSLSPNVKEALAKTPRGIFVPRGFEHLAYEIDALPIAKNQWISSPLTVAKMTEYLAPIGVDRVLEIGCGSGYQAGVLSHLFRGVFTIERIEQLVVEAKKHFKDLDYHNIHVRRDDGQNGWVGYAPYDRILFSATAKSIPPKIFEQLADDGILVAPVWVGSSQVITKFTKKSGRIVAEEMEECDFVPIVDGVEK